MLDRMDRKILDILQQDCTLPVAEIGKRVGAKYNGPEATSELALAFLEKQAHKRIGIAIDVARIASWDHRKIAGY